MLTYWLAIQFYIACQARKFLKIKIPFPLRSSSNLLNFVVFSKDKKWKLKVKYATKEDYNVLCYYGTSEHHEFSNLWVLNFELYHMYACMNVAMYVPSYVYNNYTCIIQAYSSCLLLITQVMWSKSEDLDHSWTTEIWTAWSWCGTIVLTQGWVVANKILECHLQHL